MSVFEKRLSIERQKAVAGGIPMEYVYTAGPVLEPFFNGLKKNGTFVGTKCECCETVYVPPTMFCERCFKRNGKQVRLSGKGRLMSFTVAYQDERGKKLNEPEAFGLIILEGADTPFIHRLLGSPDELIMGAEVKAVFKPKKNRKGAWEDIKGFKVE